MYWQNKAHTLPELTALALVYIWLPVSSVNVKCSFLSYNNILSDKRVALKEESIRILNFLYFNLDGNVNYDTLISD